MTPFRAFSVRSLAIRFLPTQKASRPRDGLAARWKRGLGIGLAAWCLALAVLSVAASAASPKNVIILVADGAGFNAYAVASMYQGRWDDAQGRSTQVYDGPGWVRFGCTTYSTSVWPQANDGGRKDFGLGYQPEKVWNFDAAKKTYPHATAMVTDSAAAATAMASGVKVKNGALNWTDDGKPITGGSLSEIAHAHGRSAGIVTSVPWCDATPAGFGGAHSAARKQLADIAKEMLDAPWLTVVLGGGHPEFHHNGRPNDNTGDRQLMPDKAADSTEAKAIAEAKAKEAASKKKKKVDAYAGVGGLETWQKLRAGEHPGRWRLIETKDDFNALAEGKDFGPRVLGIARIASTLQYSRAPARKEEKPFTTPFNENVPSLVTMTRGALRVLQKNEHGFFLMVEGGAVDWGNHVHQPSRVIEEMTDFLASVDAAVQWVEKNSNWDETLVIVTADHETGMLWGKDSDRVPFAPIGNLGKGQIPDVRYHGRQHTNSLVPVFARGANADRFASLARGNDPKAAAAWKIPPACVDNTDIFRVAKSVLADEPAPNGR